MLVFIATWANYLVNFGRIVYPEDGNGFDGFITDTVGSNPRDVRRLISMTDKLQLSYRLIASCKVLFQPDNFRPNVSSK
jgi:hypothetical protein